MIGFWLSGVNTYTGSANIAAGTLALGAACLIDTSSGVALGAGVTRDTPALPTFTLPAAQTDIFDRDSAAASSAGQIRAANLNIATANTGGQDPNLDWDNDGASNGVEFFMNAPAGFAAKPALGAVDII